MDDITNSDTYRQLMNLTLRFVSLRLRSEQEIYTYLVTKLKKTHTTAPKVIEAIIDRLKELGYINDEAFAQWFVDGRTGRKPKGKRVIEMELQRKGIARDIIDRVVQQTMTGEKSEKELARQIAEKKLPIWKNQPQLAQKRKLADFLTRRGFSSETVWGVVDEQFAEE